MDAVHPILGFPEIGHQGRKSVEPACGDTFTGPQARRQPPTRPAQRRAGTIEKGLFSAPSNA